MDFTKITLGELLSSENETIKRNAVAVLKQLQKQEPYHKYSDALAYQKHLRGGGEIHDAVVIGGVLFTQDEYDLNGHYITYANLKHKKQMIIETSDRYGQGGTSDAEVSIEPLSSTRIGFPYLE